MLKTLSQLEELVEGKVCRFICDHDTNTTIVKNFLVKCLAFVSQIEEKAKADQQAQPPEPAEAQSPVEAVQEVEQQKVE